MSKESTKLSSGGQFIVYQAENGKLKIDVRLEGKTVWLTQTHMAELFQTTKQNIAQHLKSIFAEGELATDSIIKNFFTTAGDGKKCGIDRLATVKDSFSVQIRGITNP